MPSAPPARTGLQEALGLTPVSTSDSGGKADPKPRFGDVVGIVQQQPLARVNQEALQHMPLSWKMCRQQKRVLAISVPLRTLVFAIAVIAASALLACLASAVAFLEVRA